MKVEELKGLSIKDLQYRLEDTLEELHNLRFQHSTHQLDNPLRIRTVRKDVARIKTLLRKNELESEGGSS